MCSLAEQNDTCIADGLTQWHEIGEVLVGGVERADFDGVLA
jgi:hypothetical protein